VNEAQIYENKFLAKEEEEMFKISSINEYMVIKTIVLSDLAFFMKKRKSSTINMLDDLCKS
jgi:hypothetical protein